MIESLIAGFVSGVLRPLLEALERYLQEQGRIRAEDEKVNAQRDAAGSEAARRIEEEAYEAVDAARNRGDPSGPERVLRHVRKPVGTGGGPVPPADPGDAGAPGA